MMSAGCAGAGPCEQATPATSVAARYETCPPDVPVPRRPSPSSAVAVCDRADDLNRMLGGQIDLHDGASPRNMHVRRRMIDSAPVLHPGSPVTKKRDVAVRTHSVNRGRRGVSGQCLRDTTGRAALLDNGKKANEDTVAGFTSAPRGEGRRAFRLGRPRQRQTDDGTGRCIVERSARKRGWLRRPS